MVDPLAPSASVACGRLAAEQLNRECFCVTLDQAALISALRVEAGDAAFADHLMATRPHLFSHSPVFLPKGDGDAMRAIVEAIEAAMQIPFFREAAMAWALRARRKILARVARSSARKIMLEELRAANFAYERVEILLAEGMIAEAIEAAGENGAHAGGAETLMRLAVAAATSNPVWVIRVALSHANAIMEQGRSGHYTEAAHWLEAASHAYIAAGRDDEWRELVESLIETHRRKHKLRPLLERLR